MTEETTHFDAAAEDSDDAEQNERRRERMERLTMDKSSIGERGGANSNAVAGKCELQNWCVSDGQTVKADKSQIGIGDKAVLKVSYATNSVCVEGCQAGGDGRVKKVTVVVHKWARSTPSYKSLLFDLLPSGHQQQQNHEQSGRRWIHLICQATAVLVHSVCGDSPLHI